jgi:hypothetical protein
MDTTKNIFFSFISKTVVIFEVANEVDVTKVKELL